MTPARRALLRLAPALVLALAATRCSSPPAPDAGDAATPDAVAADAPDAATDDATLDATHGDAAADALDDAAPDAAVDAPDAASDARDDATNDAPDATDAAPVTVRIMAANLTSGGNQSYTPGHGIRIFQGLRPDVVLIQEFNYATSTPADLRAFVTMAFGASFGYTRGGGDIPNGVVSRFPIVAAGEWADPGITNRTLVWARIDVPGPRDLWAVSLHLLSSTATGRTNAAMTVATQVRMAMPASDLLVVGGDFNTTSRTENAIVALSSVVNTAGPFPADQAGNTNTNAPRNAPYDWVLADDDLEAFEVPVAVGANRFPRGLVFDSRVYTPLADVAPVLASDSAAPSMQHMAVVRDFRLGP